MNKNKRAIIVLRLLNKIYPETSIPETVKSDIEIANVSKEENFLEALGNGATDGMKLALNIAAMLIALFLYGIIKTYTLNYL